MLDQNEVQNEVRMVSNSEMINVQITINAIKWQMYFKFFVKNLITILMVDARIPFIFSLFSL